MQNVLENNTSWISYVKTAWMSCCCGTIKSTRLFRLVFYFILQVHIRNFRFMDGGWQWVKTEVHNGIAHVTAMMTLYSSHASFLRRGRRTATEAVKSRNNRGQFLQRFARRRHARQLSNSSSCCRRCQFSSVRLNAFHTSVFRRNEIFIRLVQKSKRMQTCICNSLFIFAPARHDIVNMRQYSLACIIMSSVLTRR